MKQIFFYAVALLIPLAVGGWFLWAVGRGFASLYQDWKLGRELDELQAGSAARGAQRLAENERRLATGCQHDFETPVFGLPPGVCGKCGLEREKPLGGCDHVWRLRPGPIPNSACETCGKTFSATGDNRPPT